MRDADQARWDQHTRHPVTDLKTATGHETAKILLVVLDLPYAAVRRYLGAGRDIPATLEGIVDAHHPVTAHQLLSREGVPF